MTVRVTDHGGNCCGSKHIFTFRNDNHPGQDVRELKSILREETEEGNNKLFEVILSNRQATEKPLLIQALADLGFVQTDAWTGNHGTPVWRFSRSGRRLALNSQTFNWQGMVMNGNLAGNLDPIGGNAPYANQIHDGIVPAGAAQQPARAIRVGDTVRVINRDLIDYGREYIVRVVGDTNNNIVRLLGRANYLRMPSVELVETPQPVAERTLVHTSYHNYFRRTNTRGAGWETIYEARNAGPRCRRRDRKEVYSDGSIVWVENVDE